jgi:hypothetical protein
MPQPPNLDDRINRLVSEIDPSIRDELQKILQTLRRAEYPVGAIQMMSRLALRLFRRIYEMAGQPFPSDNLFDVIVRATKGDPDKGVKGYRILPDGMDSPLHTLRVLSNKIDHCAEQFPLGVEEAELALNSFLAVLKWFHCESGLTPKLPSIYAAESVEINRGERGKSWRPRVCYPLQPAPHFQGRQPLLATLLEWARARGSPDRVVSLVAAGGTGKTALVERVLAELGQRPPAGVLVWSFYEDPRTEAFLRAAYEYFAGEMPPSVAGLFERLQIALTGDEPHLLVLDGLERVQAEGTTGRPWGELEDPQLRRLHRWLAAGHGTRARALVTTRFPLVDLNDWKDAGYREERLEDLEPRAAQEVLRAWGVKGDDATLEALAAPLHYHALSVAVLGSYLGKLWGGDSTKAPTFDRDEIAAADPKAARLSRILAHYAEKLPDAERDLLARLSTFPRGVTVEFLGFLIDKGSQVAGALAGFSEVRLLRMVEQLRDLGLVFRYGTPHGAVFTAHPFLRDFFRNLLDVTNPEAIHETVRARLAPSLAAKPEKKPTDPAELDKYETLIEHTRLAGRRAEAYELYSTALGGFTHLGHVLGEYARGLRILSGFAPFGTMPITDVRKVCEEHVRVRSKLEEPKSFSKAEEEIQDKLNGLERQVTLILECMCDLGLFSKNLGDLDGARRAMELVHPLGGDSSRKFELVLLLHQAEIELLAGRSVMAEHLAAHAWSLADVTKTLAAMQDSRVKFALSLFRQGKVRAANSLFERAESMEMGTCLGEFRNAYLDQNGIAECRWTIGDRSSARTLTECICEAARLYNWTDVLAHCDGLLGFLSLPDAPVIARQHLDTARSYSSRSGNVEVQLRCYHLASEIARTERAYNLACSEAKAGIHLADTCGFGYYAIELRLALARAHLDAADAKAALQCAREALDRSIQPECQYAWGEADGLHLCGVAHARLGEVELARQRLIAALARREQLTHPQQDRTQAELAQLCNTP